MMMNNQWSFLKIKSLGNVITGKTPPSKLDNMFNGEIPFVTPADISLNIDETKRTLTKDGQNKSKTARKGSTLVSCIGNIGYVGNVSKDSCFNQQINAIEWNNKKIMDRFGSYSIQFSKQKIINRASRAVVPIINKTTFESIKIPVIENLFYQQKIVDILDHAHNIIQHRKKAIELTEELIEAAFYEMFGDPISNPKGWNKEALIILCDKSKNIKSNEWQEKEFNYIDISSIDRGLGIIAETNRINKGNAPSRAKQIVKTQDVIFATTRPYLRNIAIVPKTLNDQICSTGFCIFRTNIELLIPEFLYILFRTESFINFIRPLMRGAQYPAIPDSILKKQRIIIPSVKQQLKFKNIYDSNKNMIDSLQKALRLEEKQFQALLQAAFEGKLTENAGGGNGKE
jgi:type I restriction enzyme, S subunit